jgi:alpha-amylase
MRFKVGLSVFAAFSLFSKAFAAEQPVAVFHAHDQYYFDVKNFVCELAKQGYSHVQIAPTQKSNPSGEWWARYQPVDYRYIEGRGSETDLKSLIDTAHRCNVKVIADVVFNHMANMPEYQNLRFPTFNPEDFQSRCETNYNERQFKWTLHRCWLGNLPDLNVTRENVRNIHKDHLKKLLALGIDGFRLDAAKHMPQQAVEEYIDTANTRDSWNYLEVIEDANTSLEEYNRIAAVTDFRLYNTMRSAFSLGGDLRTLRVPKAVDDSRSVTFGRNHDTVREINSNAVYPYENPADAHFATAYVLARESGTPLILNTDNYSIPLIKYGVKFRQIMHQRGKDRRNVRESVLAVIDNPTVLLMERGSEGFFVVNKAAEKFNVPKLDMTLTNLEGCYRELRNNFTAAIERKSNGKKYITRWGTWQRGGLEVYGRDALYFIREPWQQCQ